MTRSQLYRNIRDFAGKPCTGDQILRSLQFALGQCGIDLACAALAWGTPPFGILFKTAQTPQYGYLTLLNIKPEQLDAYTDSLATDNGRPSTLSDMFKDDADTLPQWLNIPTQAEVEDLEDSLVKKFEQTAHQHKTAIHFKNCAANTIREIRKLYLEPVGCTVENGSLLYVPVYDSAGNYLFQGAFAFRDLESVRFVSGSNSPLGGNVTQIVTHAIRIFMAQAQALATEVQTDLSDYRFHASLSLANQSSHNLGHTVKRALTKKHPEDLAVTLDAVHQRLTLLAAQTSHHMLPVSATIFTNQKDLLPDFVKQTLWASDVEAAGFDPDVEYMFTGFAQNPTAIKAGFVILPYGVTGGLVYVRAILENFIRNTFRHAEEEEFKRFASMRRLFLTVTLEAESDEPTSKTCLIVRIRGYTADEATSKLKSITDTLQLRHLFIRRDGLAIQERSRGLADIKQSCCLLAGITAESALEELATLNLSTHEVNLVERKALQDYGTEGATRLPWGPDFLYVTRSMPELYGTRGASIPRQIFDLQPEYKPDDFYETLGVYPQCGYYLSIPLQTAGAALFTSDPDANCSGTRVKPLDHVEEVNFEPFLTYAVHAPNLSPEEMKGLKAKAQSNVTLPSLYIFCDEAPKSASEILHDSYVFQLKRSLGPNRRVIVQFQNCSLKEGRIEALTEFFSNFDLDLSLIENGPLDLDALPEDALTIVVAHDGWLISECCKMLLDKAKRRSFQLYPWASNTILRDSFDLVKDPSQIAPILLEFIVASCSRLLIYHETLYKAISSMRANVKGIDRIDGVPISALQWLEMNEIDVVGPKTDLLEASYIEMFDSKYDFLLIHASFLDKGLANEKTRDSVRKLVEDNKHRLILISTSGRRTLDLRDGKKPESLRFIQFDVVERSLTRINQEVASKADLYRLCLSATSMT